MFSLFFDLETSDKNPIGQIINYAFLLVDRNFEVVDELCGLVRVSRLQLPSPEALIANQTIIADHQAQAEDNEKAAMLKISKFLQRCIEWGEGVKLPIIGYNSSRFDIPYLRTSMIRNGLNPYFGGQLQLRDLLFASKKLAINRADFPRTPSTNPSRQDGKLSLSLENLSQQFGLLDGAQSHESRDDVLVTIKLARTYLERFDLDVRRFDPFEALSEARPQNKGKIAWSAYPNYELSEENRYNAAPMVLLDCDHRSSLWVDLNRYAEGQGRRSIQWYNHTGGSAFVKGDHGKEDLELAARSVAALKEFSDITVKNFFKPSTCDIEQDIYRLDFDAIDALHQAIWKGDDTRVKQGKSRDAKIIYMRHTLANASHDKPLSERYAEMLKQYALYRYGGKAQISKIGPDEANDPAQVEYHPTWNTLQDSILSLKSEKKGKDLQILNSLEKFYADSEIFKYAGTELQSISLTESSIPSLKTA